jgi:mannose-6-phosphate isomerase-like protein (cupin superfamily)
MTIQLANQIHQLSIPLELDKGINWKPLPIFRGSTPNLEDLACHVSALAPGHSPHPPHRHPEEELLLLLAGDVDLILPDSAEKRIRLRCGEFVYYPAEFLHTIESAGDEPANYLMLKWRDASENVDPRLSFRRFDVLAREAGHQAGAGWRAGRLFEGATAYLKKLHSHVSVLELGAGYEPHADGHDVVIILFQGEVETLSQRVRPKGVIFHSAGQLHGIRNVGAERAKYLVFEFHGLGNN